MSSIIQFPPFQRAVVMDAVSITTNTTTNSSVVYNEPHAMPILATIHLPTRTDGTYVIRIQHSPDGTRWENLSASASGIATTSGFNSIGVAFGTYSLPYLRVTVVSTSVTTGATATVVLYY